MNKDFPRNVADGLEDSDEEMIEYQSEYEGSDENKDPDDDNSEDEKRAEDGEVMEISRDAKAKRDLFIMREANQIIKDYYSRSFTSHYKKIKHEVAVQVEVPAPVRVEVPAPVRVEVPVPVRVEVPVRVVIVKKPEHNCQYGCTNKFKPVGCFRDKHVRHHRPMPRYLLSMRSKHSRVYAGYILKWKDYKNSLQKFLCHCASLAAKKGYNYFGIQYYGECWGAHTIQYRRDGVSSACINTSFKKCNLTKDCKCTGKGNANFVYNIVK